MIDIVLISNFFKIFFISVLSYYTNLKIIDYKECNTCVKILIVLIAFIIAMLYIFLEKFLLSVGAFIFSFLIYIIIINEILKNNNKNICNESIILSVIVSIIISYIFYLIATLISGIILLITVTTNLDYKSPISLVIIPIIELILLYGLFKIKRFKHGFNFIKNKNYSKNLLIFFGLFSVMIIFIFTFLQRDNNLIFNTYLAILTIISFAIILKFLLYQITKQYKRNMRDRTIEIQTKEIVEQSKIIKEIKEENLKLAETIHKYNNRLSALELGIANALKNNNKTEFANELGLMLEETKELSKNFAEETTINKTNLPKTNIIGLDNMFKYFQNEANKNNIDFNVIINENIEDLLKIIDKPKLETLIGDHLKDAIIAVNKSKNPYKSILVILGISNKCYEISICDSGIEFEIDTLLKLGKERVTTHKEEGGSGIGFITTFKTLKETKASLEIEEYNPRTTNYTKSIVIRFDGKNEYRIYSYRAEEIKKKNNEKRIIIEEL